MTKETGRRWLPASVIQVGRFSEAPVLRDTWRDDRSLNQHGLDFLTDNFWRAQGANGYRIMDMVSHLLIKQLEATAADEALAIGVTSIAYTHSTHDLIAPVAYLSLTRVEAVPIDDAQKRADRLIHAVNHIIRGTNPGHELPMLLH